MKHVVAMFIGCSFLVGNVVSAQDWSIWRGPAGNGLTQGENPPVSWSETANVLWKAPVPGRGHASPTVVGDRIFLATSDVENETQAVVCFDFNTGRQLWMTEVNRGNFNPRIYPTNTHASSTVVSDGTRLFAVFNNNQSAQLVALDLEGNILWETQAADFLPKRYQFGFGSSPVLHDGKVIVTSECERDGSMAAFRVEDGSEVWRVSRADATSYSTPVIAEIGGREQMILSGANKVQSFDPSDGSLLWTAPGSWEVTCGTAVWDDQNVYVSGGYPQGQTLAVRADGSGEVVWDNPVKFYEQSLLLHEGYLYGLADNGVAYCFRARDGETMWRQRLEKKVSASPVLAGGNIYISAESGNTYVFRATPEGYQQVSQNVLGNTAYATPTFVRDRIIVRVAAGSGQDKQETLYCIGQ